MARISCGPLNFLVDLTFDERQSKDLNPNRKVVTKGGSLIGFSNAESNGWGSIPSADYWIQQLESNKFNSTGPTHATAPRSQDTKKCKNF
jgi:hypothetical protein